MEVTMTKTLSDLHQEYPEHFASGVQNTYKDAIKAVQARYPDFNESFPSGRENCVKKREIPINLFFSNLHSRRRG